jgi:hypothetical protein
MQNKANFPRFYAKNRDSHKKRTQNKANQTQFFGFFAVRSTRYAVRISGVEPANLEYTIDDYAEVFAE